MPTQGNLLEHATFPVNDQTSDAVQGIDSLKGTKGTRTSKGHLEKQCSVCGVILSGARLASSETSD